MELQPIYFITNPMPDVVCKPERRRSESILELSKELIRIPSTKDNPEALEAVLDVVKNELADFSYKEFRHEGVPSLLFYNTPELPERFRVMLNIHLDVVSGSSEQYEPSVKDGKLYGRGAHDMKGSSAAIIRAYKEMAKTLPYPIGLQVVVDEETGGLHGTKHQLEQGVRADFVIAGEPTQFGINNKAKGVLWVEVNTCGKSAHGAHLWNGKNAIKRMTKFLRRVERKFPVPDEEVWETTVNVARIGTTNNTTNKVPDNCRVVLDTRFIPEDSKKILKRLKKLLRKKSSMETILFDPAVMVPDDHPDLLLLQTATQTVMGVRSETMVTHGTSDVRHYQKYNCPGVTFGPVGGGLHEKVEWVDLQSLDDYHRVIKEFLVNVK